MAALRDLFKRRESIDSNSLVSGSESHKERSSRLTTRIDAVYVQWTGHHVYVRNETKIGDDVYNHSRTSLSQAHKNEIPRAVYLMVQLKRLRELSKTLEQELEAYRVACEKTGLFASRLLPQDLSLFLLADPEIQKLSRGDEVHPQLKSADVMVASAGILGLLIACSE